MSRLVLVLSSLGTISNSEFDWANYLLKRGFVTTDISLGLTAHISGAFQEVMLSILLLILLAGCRTINSSDNSSDYRGADIPATEKYELVIADYGCVPSRDGQKIVIQPQEIKKSINVQMWRRSWQDVTRKRYLSVVGIHDDYSFMCDISSDLIAGCIIGPLGLCIGILDLPLGETEIFMDGLAAFVGILPGISYSVSAKTELVKKHYKEQKISPELKTSITSAAFIRGMVIDWELSDVSGFCFKSGHVKWPEPIVIPRSDWLSEKPQQSTLTLKVSSRDISLSGNTVKTWQYTSH